MTLEKENRLIEAKWAFRAAATWTNLNAITPIICRGHHLSTERVKSQQERKYCKAESLDHDLDHDLKQFSY